MLSDNNRRNVVAGLLLLLGVGLGVNLVYWRGRQRQPQLPRPVSFFPGAAGGSDVWTRLLDTLAGLQAGQGTLESFLDALRRHADDPVARDFAAAFLQDPELRGLWEEFEHAGDPSRAGEVLRKLGRSQRFLDLLEKYKEEPRFSALGDSLASELAAEVAMRSSSLPLSTEPPLAPADAALRRTLPQLKPAGKLSDSFAASFESLFSMMRPEARRKVLDEVERGATNLAAACLRAKEEDACRAAWQSCLANPACAKAISGEKGFFAAPPRAENDDKGPDPGGGSTPGEPALLTAEGVKTLYAEKKAAAYAERQAALAVEDRGKSARQAEAKIKQIMAARNTCLSRMKERRAETDECPELKQIP